MATAIANGLLKNGVIKSNSNISFGEKFSPRRKYLEENYKGALITEKNSDAAKDANLVFVAVKPNDAKSAFKSINDQINKEATVISIMAGINLSFMEMYLPDKSIVRTMPNTPALVNEMACGFCCGKNVSESQRKDVSAVLNSIGMAHEVEEKLLDPITGLSGSGPAFVFIFIEALADAGVYKGLPRKVAIDLAAKTVLGSAKMVIETGKHTGQLKDMVTSPGGTTIAGVRELERGNFRSSVIAAVDAATKRSIKMSE